MAQNLEEARMLDAETPPQEIWIDDEWRKINAESASSNGEMGFTSPKP